jgi:hypothetical protein
MAKGKFRSVRIEKAGNGFSVHTERDPEIGGDGKQTPYTPQHPMVFKDEDHGEMIKHIHGLTNPGGSGYSGKGELEGGGKSGLRDAILASRPLGGK